MCFLWSVVVCLLKLLAVKVQSAPAQNVTLAVDFNFTCGYQDAADYSSRENITHTFPWVALLGYEQDSDLFLPPLEPYGCTASLISSRYVLTAAHCVRLRTAYVTSVHLGGVEGSIICVNQSNPDECCNPAETFGIEEKIKHPSYSRRTGVNDIALLRLNRSVSFTDSIRPICLPPPNTTFPDIGDILTFAGFGRVSEESEAILKKMLLTRLISNAECAHKFSIFPKKTRNVTENILCTQDLGSNKVLTCPGDSGSPVMFSRENQWHIEGVLSWGVSICGNLFPQAYTRVQNYLNWINDNMRP